MTESSTRILAVLGSTAATLRERQRSFALVGGLAVSVRVEPRFTRDIDLVVAVADDPDAETLTGDLQAAGYGLQLSLEQQALGRLATVRLLPPGEHSGGIVIDLLFASSGIERDICAAADEIPVGNVLIPVATTGHLLAMKLLSRAAHRPQDEIDLQALFRILTPVERARAVAAVDSIERVGANRGRHLRAELDQLLNNK